MQRSFQKSIAAYTLIELIVALVISALVLGTIFYLMSSSTSRGLEAQIEAKFLRDFYAFNGVFNTWDMSLLQDNIWNISDVGLVTSPGISGGIMFWIVDIDTYTLVSQSDAGIYKKTVFGYRSLSQTEFDALTDSNNPSSPYNLVFQKDKVLEDFFIKNMQLVPYNNGDIVDMSLEVVAFFFPDYEDTSWDELPQDDIKYYTLSF